MIRKFKKQELLDLGLPYECDGGKIIKNEIFDQNRWSTSFLLIFQLNDQKENEAWQTIYSKGSTESQDERPWEYEDEILCKLVNKTEKVVEVWEPVKNKS